MEKIIKLETIVVTGLTVTNNNKFKFNYYINLIITAIEIGK